MRLDRFLAELLYDHDCVIIPGFGGLVASYRPARLNDRTHIISPPAKHIGFNRNLLRHDGLLVHHVASTLGIAYAEAQSEVDSCVAGYRSQLAGGKRVVWEKIGFIFQDRGGSLQFIPDEQENFLLEAYGLSPIQLRPVAIGKEQQEHIREITKNVAHPSRRRWLAVAAVALPVLMAAGWLIGLQMGSGGNTTWAGFNPFHHEVQSEYTLTHRSLPSDSEVVAENTGLSALLNEPGLADTIRFSFVDDHPDPAGILIRLSDPIVINPVVIAPAAKDASLDIKAYSVIAGAFLHEDNAEKLVAQFQSRGFSAMIIGKSRGLHLVSCGNYDTHLEASTAARNLRENEQVKAWVKKNQ